MFSACIEPMQDRHAWKVLTDDKVQSLVEYGLCMHEQQDLFVHGKVQ